MDNYQRFIHLSRYARWLGDRRETWEETVQRYTDFFPDLPKDVHTAILNMDVMPSMRALWAAGPALSRDHVAGYNCAYVPIDNTRAFDEILFILMCGTGVGFSVERDSIRRLPTVAENFERSDTTIVVRDSKRGWAEGLREFVSLLYTGRIPQWDTSRIRPAGSRLKTMGGSASGPEPLEELFRFLINVFTGAAGRRLTTIEVHDVVCKIGECVVVGGVRRSALISLSNLSDPRMREAKSGQWWETAPWRALSNNSVAYTSKPDPGAWMEEWLALYRSKSGERGIFNREGATKAAGCIGRPTHYDNGDLIDWGLNPCGEIVLRPMQFCNLSTVVARPDDTVETLEDKVRLATIIGTVQSTITNFRYLRKKWRDNCEEERLLGVSVTGAMECEAINPGASGGQLAGNLHRMREVARATNVEWADRLDIPRSAAITCVKPEGTASQLVGAGSGISPWWNSHFIRRVKMLERDPLTRFMREVGFPCEDDQTTSGHVVFSFPRRAPDGAVTRHDLSARGHLEYWKTWKHHWCDHNPSVTIYPKEDEWPGVGAWVYENWDAICGLSFLPSSDHIYRQAPYEDITADQYEDMVAEMPTDVDWSALVETEDSTGDEKEYCGGDVCLTV